MNLTSFRDQLSRTTQTTTIHLSVIFRKASRTDKLLVVLAPYPIEIELRGLSLLFNVCFDSQMLKYILISDCPLALLFECPSFLSSQYQTSGLHPYPVQGNLTPAFITVIFSKDTQFCLFIKGNESHICQHTNNSQKHTSSNINT